MGRRAASFGSVDTEEAPPKPFSDGAVRVSVAAAWSGISRSLLFRLMRTGQIPHSRPGRERLLCKASLVWVLQRHRGM